MTTDTDFTEEETISFLVVAFGSQGNWQLRQMAYDADDDTITVATIVTQLRSIRSEGAVVALMCIDDDWCAVLRLIPGGVRILMSDATAALDYTLARDMLDELGVDIPTHDEVDACDDPWPEGEFNLLDDLGANEQVMSIIFDDAYTSEDSNEAHYAYDQILRVADELGFAEELVELVGVEQEF